MHEIAKTEKDKKKKSKDGGQRRKRCQLPITGGQIVEPSKKRQAEMKRTVKKKNQLVFDFRIRKRIEPALRKPDRRDSEAPTIVEWELPRPRGCR